MELGPTCIKLYIMYILTTKSIYTASIAGDLRHWHVCFPVLCRHRFDFGQLLHSVSCFHQSEPRLRNYFRLLVSDVSGSVHNGGPAERAPASMRLLPPGLPASSWPGKVMRNPWDMVSCCSKACLRWFQSSYFKMRKAMLVQDTNLAQ
jgi:hypothetical protein